MTTQELVKKLIEALQENFDERSGGAARMQMTLERASRIQPPHRFDVGQGTKFDATPKLSKAGQFYLDCQRCGRAIFEDGSGSAGQNVGCG